MTRDDLDKLAEALGGVSILGCLPNSPGARAGLRYGDVLLEVNGIPTPDLGSYVEAIRERGESMRLKVFRQGVEHCLELSLERIDAPIVPKQLLNRIAGSGLLPKSVSAELPPEAPAQFLS